jgi:exonuclease SbcC
MPERNDTMKILKLKFKNINSLAGVNEIDFTASGFIDDGIFAITGKTGAGKSSILDAVSLALYGKTPRVEITGQSNDVMTHGANDCFSEIVFESGGKQWKASWKQERTRTGKLKPVNRLIADSTDQIVTGKASECHGKIVEILGLTFEQFTKVMMLAQGGFAAFLQADKNDKGELLEQITGTEVYGKISQKVFERNKTEKEKLDRILLAIGAIKILAEEEIITLKNEMAECEKQKRHIDRELQSLENAKQWLVDLENLQKQINDAKTKLPDLEQNVETSKTALEQAEAALRLAKTGKETSDKILTKVRELDTRIAEKDNALNPVLDLLKKRDNEIQELKKDSDAQNLSFHNREAEFKNHVEVLKSRNEALESKKSELLHLLEGQQISDYHAEKEQMTGLGKEIKNLIDNLRENIFYKSEIHHHEQVIESHLPKIRELSGNIPTDKVTAGNLEKQMGLLRDNIAFLEKIKSWEDHRKSLKDGEECPLCGSTEHPFARENVPQTSDKEKELRSLNLQFKALIQHISDNENALTKLHSDNENAEKNIKSAQNQLEENRKKTKRILVEIQQSGQPIPEILETHDGIADWENLRKQEQENYIHIDHKIKTAEALEKSIGTLRDVEIPKHHSAIEMKKNALNTLKNSIALLQTRISEKEEQRRTQDSGKKTMEKERHALIAERYDLFGDKRVEDEEKHVRESLENADIVKTNAENERFTANTELAKHLAVIDEKAKEWSEKRVKTMTEKTLEALQSEWDEKKKQLDDVSQRIGAIRQNLGTNDENVKNCGQKLHDKELQQKVCDRWAGLNALIGSADGKKYRNFAQALTFEHLIGLTNIQLQKMSERYVLKRFGDATNPLELSVIDKFQNCEERTVQNLSGGEKFIVSLALALGLANMAGKNMRIDTMFIDEGFGTLDSDYLDVALSALSNLRHEGKLIGVISHLTELKERIPTHLEVLPSGNGYSKIVCKS